MNELFVEGQEFFIISDKLKQTYSPFQKVLVVRSFPVPETGAVLVQVRDIRFALLWFGQEELQEARDSYSRHSEIISGKRAYLQDEKPNETWSELKLRGYQMAIERETLSKSSRSPLLPIMLGTV